MMRLMLGAAAALVLTASQAAADGLPSYGKARAAEDTRVCSTTGNVGVTSDYVFRGISQNNEDAAVQGGVDFSCGRFYVGFWGSSSAAADNSTEVDVYAGVKGKYDRFDWDLGVIYYAYPGQNSHTNADFFEFKAAASTEVWKGGTVGGTVFYSPDYAYSTGPVTTLEATFTQALPKFSIFTPTFSAAYGHSYFSDELYNKDPSYSYWNVGLTLGFAERWSLDLRYWDTSDEANHFTLDNSVIGDRYIATLKYTF